MNMDLIGVTAIREPRTDADLLPLRPGERPIGGGTWLYSEPQQGFDTIVDLTALSWPEVEESDETLTLAATARLRTVHAFGSRFPLFAQCTDALLASWKVWNVATIGGNLCFGVPASAMVSLCTALDASVVIWGSAFASVPEPVEGVEAHPGLEPASGDTDVEGASTGSANGVRRQRVADFIVGPQLNTLQPGELVRAIEFPRSALAQRTAFRKIALADLGRSGAVVIGREDGTLSITAATARPHVIRADNELDAIDDWYDDAHGSADWREAMVRKFVAEIRAEL